jgi:hypothetical protein
MINAEKVTERAYHTTQVNKRYGRFNEIHTPMQAHKGLGKLSASSRERTDMVTLQSSSPKGALVMMTLVYTRIATEEVTKVRHTM